jgi:hypothetical protein
MIPSGTPDGQAFATGMNALAKPGNIGVVAKQATDWVEAAITAVRFAPDSPYKSTGDETIAGILLDKIEERDKEIKARFLSSSKPPAVEKRG